jgi:transposase
MKKKYPVLLTQTERDDLKGLIASGTAPARKLTHARILLKADQSPEGPGWVDDAVAEAVEVSQPTVSRVRKQYFEDGLQAALNRRAPNREYHRKLDGEQEARLIALACSEPPEGQARWSLRLLADKLIELEIVEEEISYQTVRRTLKKRSQATPEKAVVDPTTEEWPVRVEDGGCA